jgi:hypothetical protein
MSPKPTLTNEQYHGRMDNAEASAIRVGQHEENWQLLSVGGFARRHGWTINFAGFWGSTRSARTRDTETSRR